jgi:hypothetical protein
MRMHGNTSTQGTNVLKLLFKTNLTLQCYSYRIGMYNPFPLSHDSLLTNQIKKMKKIIFLALILILAPLVINAQAGVGLGIKAGANFANQNAKDISTKSVTDYLVGGYLNLNFSDKFGVTPEVLFTANATKWDDVKVNMNYFAIPVMLRVLPVPLLSLEAGPQFSFLTKATVEGVGDIKDQLKKNDFGLAFGAGLHLPLGINIGARYVLGFTNISDVSDESIKNRTFQLYAGWTFLGAK